MTSKEALNDLKERIIHPEYFGKREMLDELIIIQKDLEVLEHLKLLFNGYNILKEMGITYEDMYLLCKKSDDDLIKEWLKNE